MQAAKFVYFHSQSLRKFSSIRTENFISTAVLDATSLSVQKARLAHLASGGGEGKREIYGKWFKNLSEN